MLEGVAAAQEAITADYADAWEAGNATLLGGIALQLKTNASTKWCFYCANVGDCKVFHAASSTGRVEGSFFCAIAADDAVRYHSW